VTNVLGTPATEAGEEISGLVRKLNRTDGISFVYEVLEELAQRYRLDDAVIRIESALGEGFFRLHRATVDHELLSRVPAGPAVLFATPDVVPPDIAQSALELCVLALRLCVSRHSRHLDRQTGLLADHSFNDVLETSAAQAARHAPELRGAGEGRTGSVMSARRYVPPKCEDCGVALLRGSSKKGDIRIERRNLGGKRRVHNEAACRGIRTGKRTR